MEEESSKMLILELERDELFTRKSKTSAYI